MLIRHLIATMGLTHVLAHQQSSGSRTNDPGPDIWRQVGQWAVQRLGMRDGGAGFKIGSGNPIPEEWRTWSRPITPELASTHDREGEEEAMETELAHDAQTARSPHYLHWVRDLQQRTFAKPGDPPPTGCSCSRSNGLSAARGGSAPPPRFG